MEKCIDIFELIFNFIYCLIEDFELFCEYNMYVNIEKKNKSVIINKF